MASTQRLLKPSRLIGAAIVVVLLVAMVLSTKFLNPTELADALPKKFDPKATGAEVFTRAKAELPVKVKPLGEVIPAIQSDTKAAAQTYGAVSPGEGSYVFPVTTTATVIDASAASLRLKVDGAGDTPVLVPLTTAINGTTIRDVMGFKFADAPGQTDFQRVGDELKKLMQTEISGEISDPASLKGKQVTVIGAVGITGSGNAVPKAKPISVQPISVKEA